MQMKLRNEEIVKLYNTLAYVNLPGTVKFKYLLAKNERLIRPVVEALQDGAKFEHENQEEYNKKKQQLHRDFTTDAETGKPITKIVDEKTGQIERTVPLAKQDDYMKAIEDLGGEYKEMFEEMEKHQREVSKLMSESQEIEIAQIPFKEIPDSDNFRQQDFNILVVLFGEPEEATTE